MSLKTDILDAVIAGNLPYIVSRQQVMDHFPHYSESYSGVILSNSEIEQGASPTYDKFTTRIGRGVYEIHPQIVTDRRNGNII